MLQQERAVRALTLLACARRRRPALPRLPPELWDLVHRHYLAQPIALVGHAPSEPTVCHPACPQRDRLLDLLLAFMDSQYSSIELRAFGGAEIDRALRTIPPATQFFRGWYGRFHATANLHVAGKDFYWCADKGYCPGDPECNVCDPGSWRSLPS